MPQSDKRYVCKEEVVVDAEIAERLGVEGGVEFEQWIDPGEVVRRVFGILPDQAKAIREEYPAPWTVSQGFGVTEVFSPTKKTEQLTFALQSEPFDNFEVECDCFRSSAVPSLADARNTGPRNGKRSFRVHLATRLGTFGHERRSARSKLRNPHIEAASRPAPTGHVGPFQPSR